MGPNRRTVSIGSWVVAGVPILGTFVQATLALVGTSASTVPVLGGLKRTLQTIPIFDAAGVIFRNSSSVVLLLFVLVALAWVVEGISLLVLRNREFTYAAAGFTTLFLALFVLIYLPLFSRGIAMAQVIGFLSIPLVAAGASWACPLAFEWDVNLDDEATAALSDARASLETANTTLETTVDSRADEQTRRKLRTVAPDAVDDFEQGLAEVRDQLADLKSRLATVDSPGGGMSSRDRRRKARSLQQEAAEFDAERRAEMLIADLRDDVVNAVQREFGDLHVTSRYGRAYDVRNLREYNEVRLPTIDGPPAQVGGRQHELGERLATAAETEPLADVADALERANTHVKNLTETLRNHEAAVANELDDAAATVERAREQVENLSGPARERLVEFLFEGRVSDDIESVPTEPDLQAQRDTVTDLLHQCKFDDARRKATEVREEATRLQQIAEFFSESVVATIDHGSGTIPIPPNVAEALVERMRHPIEEAYAVTVSVTDGSVRIEATDREFESPADRSTTSGEARGSSGTTANVSDGPPTDDVVYVLRELRDTAAATSTEDVVELQTDALPEKFVTDSILGRVESFARRQSGVKSVRVPDEPPGYVEIRVSDGATPQRVLDRLQDQYLETHGS